jgi:hypothetical protein
MPVAVQNLILVAVWVLIGTTIEVAIAESWGENEIATPKVFYSNTNMNWFGCWFCYIIIRIVSPFITVCLLIFYIIFKICCFIHWLFIAGRKDN